MSPVPNRDNPRGRKPVSHGNRWHRAGQMRDPITRGLRRADLERRQQQRQNEEGRR